MTFFVPEVPLEKQFHFLTLSPIGCNAINKIEAAPGPLNGPPDAPFHYATSFANARVISGNRGCGETLVTGHLNNWTASEWFGLESPLAVMPVTFKDWFPLRANAKLAFKQNSGLYLMALIFAVCTPAMRCATSPVITCNGEDAPRTFSSHVLEPVFRPSHESLLRQNEEIDRMELPRIQNEEELEQYKASGDLVPLMPAKRCALIRGSRKTGATAAPGHAILLMT